MTIQTPFLFKLGCACMASVMVFGAKFGHSGQLSQNGSNMFMKAQLYNVTNAFAFFGCSIVPRVHSIPFKLAATCFVLALPLFILPLYYTAIKQQKHKVLSKLMPVGGGAMIIGWSSLFLAA